MSGEREDLVALAAGGFWTLARANASYRLPDCYFGFSPARE
jgi:hypothetical protein